MSVCDGAKDILVNDRKMKTAVIFSEDAAASAALESGALDLIYGGTARSAQRLSNSGYQLVSGPGKLVQVFRINATRGPFRNEKFRQAFNYLMDRANILRLGGIPRMNTYSKLYLALLGQFPWKYLPAIPVEMVLLPGWSFFHIYKMSSWSRAMLVPLAIINHFKPTRSLPGNKQLHELYPLGT